MSDNQKPKVVGEIRNKYSPTSVRVNLRIEPSERDSFKKVQEMLKEYTGGKRITSSILFTRMLNLYVSQLMEPFIEVQQKVEAGYMKKADQPEALRKAMAPEIAALMRAGGHTMKKVK